MGWLPFLGFLHVEQEEDGVKARMGEASRCVSSVGVDAGSRSYGRVAGRNDLVGQGVVTNRNESALEETDCEHPRQLRRHSCRPDLYWSD